MTNKSGTKVINLDEYRALKNLVEEASKDELEVASRFLEALESVKDQLDEPKPKG